MGKNVIPRILIIITIIITVIIIYWPGVPTTPALGTNSPGSVVWLFSLTLQPKSPSFTEPFIVRKMFAPNSAQTDNNSKSRMRNWYNNINYNNNRRGDFWPDERVCMSVFQWSRQKNRWHLWWRPQNIFHFPTAVCHHSALQCWLQKIPRLSRTPEAFFRDSVVNLQCLNIAKNSS